MARSRKQCCHGNAIMRSLCSADVHMCCEQYNKYWERCHGSRAMCHPHCCDRVAVTPSNAIPSSREVPIYLPEFDQIWSLSTYFRKSADECEQTDGHETKSTPFATYVNPSKKSWSLPTISFPHSRDNNINVLIFRRIIPVVFYLQFNVGSFESKHNYLMLSLFKLTTCFGPCTGPSSGHNI